MDRQGHFRKATPSLNPNPNPSPSPGPEPNQVFFAKYDPKAVWYDDLEPLDGMELPWESAGLPRPCIDEPCQIEWIDEYLSEYASA